MTPGRNLPKRFPNAWCLCDESKNEILGKIETHVDALGKRGAYGDDRSGVRPIASRLYIDKWWIELNREMFEMGKWKHPGIESSLECEYEREKELKGFNERFILVQRLPQSQFREL